MKMVKCPSQRNGLNKGQIISECPFEILDFPKKSVLKIFIILFEQDCPEAVVHGLG